MNRLLKFTGILTWIYLVYKITEITSINFYDLIRNSLAIIGVVAIVFLGVKLLNDKNRLFIKTFFIGSDLSNSIEKFLDSLPNPNNAEKANLLAHLIYRFTRIGIFTLLIASIPIALLYKQNNLLEYQNQRLTQQTYLQEADRRSSLVFLFSNIMDAVNKELTEDYSLNEKRDLSPQLIGRIIALSTRLKPYYYLEKDDLIENELSPERGQLLISLVEANLDATTLNQIMIKSDFSYSDLRNADLSHSDLSHIKLNYSNLENTTFNKSIINAAQIENCNISKGNFQECDLTETSFYKSDLSKTKIYRTTTYNTNFKYCKLNHSRFSNANLKGSFMENAILDSAYIDMQFVTDLNSLLESDSIWGRTSIINEYKIDSTLRYIHPQTKEKIFNIRLINKKL